MRTAVLALGALACLGAPAQAEIASYYGSELAGRRTASGERFNPSAMTAAHRTLRFGTRVRVTNSRNGRSVVFRINDRGLLAPCLEAVRRRIVGTTIGRRDSVFAFFRTRFWLS